MSMMKKLQSSGIAKRVMAEAKKPENQAKVKRAVQQVTDKRKPGRPH